MPPSQGSNQPPASQKTGRPKGKRYELSARAQAVLTWILEDIIEKTLEDAKRMAEVAGKQRVELAEVEEALKRLCERYHARWNSPKTDGKRPTSASRKHLPRRF